MSRSDLDIVLAGVAERVDAGLPSEARDALLRLADFRVTDAVLWHSASGLARIGRSVCMVGGFLAFREGEIALVRLAWHSGRTVWILWSVRLRREWMVCSADVAPEAQGGWVEIL